MSRLLRLFRSLFYRRDCLASGLFLLYATHAFGDTAALEHLQKRAEHGDTQSQLALVKRYANGIELPRDPALAIKWLTKAADQGDPEAQFYLGWLYAHGKGVPQDDELAFIWMKRAAQQNDAQAQYWLARFYQHGVGTPLDRRLAHYWYQKACTHRLEVACRAAKKPATDAPAPHVPLTPQPQEAP